MIVATAGHVDHGKTLLVKALTGVDTDRLPEEKQRGLTIELGFAYHDLGDGSLTGFIDVPGHERFIRTMVAGVSGIDVVLFIIAADDGPMPQTAEHLNILDLLGVSRGVVALTKIDRVSEARLAEVSEQVRALLAATPLAAAPLVPVSALEGRGIETLRETLSALGASVPRRPDDGNFRLAIDRSFLLKGAGRIVTGTVFSGRVAHNDTVHHVPHGGELRVRGIHAQNREADSASAGQRTALNLVGAGLRETELRRGDWIVGSGAALATRRLDAEIRVLSSEGRALRNRTPVHVHIGAADVTGRLVTFDGKAIEPGQLGLTQLMLDRDLHAVYGDRIVLRDQSARRTLAGGTVLDPLPDIRGRGRRERAAYLAAMHNDDVAAALNAALIALDDGVDLARFARTRNLRASEAEALYARIPMVVINSAEHALGFEPARWETLKAQLSPALAACHAQAPERAGATEAEIARQLEPRPKPALLTLLLNELLAVGAIERDGAVLRLPGHAARRAPADEALWQRVRPLLDCADLKTPVVHDMLEPLGMAFKPLEAFLIRSAQEGYLVRISAKRYLLPASMVRLEAMVHELARSQPDGVFSVADFRNHSGIGRNAVVEILEYFDRVGVTRRHGQVRKVIGDDARRGYLHKDPTMSTAIHTETAAGLVAGTCDARFSEVAERFIENFERHDEVGASCVVTLDGETLVDLWGGRTTRGGAAWQRDTLCTVFSATKGAMALTAHMLADRGRLDLDAAIGDYWPEFACAGKEDALVKMTLDHSAGVPHVRGAVPAGGFYDYDYMVGRVAAEPAFWAPGTRGGYHAITMAWTVGEIVHRAGGQRMGAFFDAEVARPLGLDFWIGAPASVEARISPMIPAEPDEAWLATRFIQAALSGEPSATQLFMRDFMLLDVNTAECHQAEVGSANGVTNARGLAGLYAPLANGGTSNGTQLVGADTLARMGRVSMASHDDATLLIPTRFALGYMKATDNRQVPNTVNSSLLIGDEAFGHVGAGGSLGFADPECGMSFGYAMNRMGTGLLMNERGQGLVDAAYRAVGYRGSDSGAWKR